MFECVNNALMLSVCNSRRDVFIRGKGRGGKDEIVRGDNDRESEGRDVEGILFCIEIPWSSYSQ